MIAGGGYAKIGISHQHPSRQRLANLQLACPFDLSVFVTKRVAGVRVGEKELNEIREYVSSLEECSSERLFRVKVAVRDKGKRKERMSLRWMGLSETAGMQYDTRRHLYYEDDSRDVQPQEAGEIR